MAVCPPNSDFKIDLARHAILNSIRAGVKKCKEYGEVIVCCDGPNNWRKTFFPHYKAHRKKMDVKHYWQAINEIKLEIKQHFPYKIIEVETAEADDVIAVLAQEIFEDNIIVSNDKDMVQLMSIGVKIFSPIKDKYIIPTREYTKDKQKIVEEISPEKFLLTHILQGVS